MAETGLPYSGRSPDFRGDRRDLTREFGAAVLADGEHRQHRPSLARTQHFLTEGQLTIDVRHVDIDAVV